MSSNEERGNSASDAAVAQVDAVAHTPAEQRMSIQYTVSRILAEASDFDAAAARILETIGEAFAWKLGALWMIDRNALYCHTLWHASSTPPTQFEWVSQRMHFSSDMGLPGRVWATGEPASVSDVREDNNFPRIIAAENEDLRAAFAFPIRSSSETLGVIEFFSVEIRSPDTDLMQAVMTIGNQIGQFIEKKRVEEAMRASEARKAAILQTALDAIITMDSKGRVIEFNPAAEQMFGYSRDQMLGQEMANLIIPPSLHAQHSRGLSHYLETGEGPIIGERIEVVAMHSDGSEFPVELAITRIPLDGPPMFTGYIRDITARRRVEEERAQLLQREKQIRAESEAANKRLEALLAITDTALTYLALDDLLRELLTRIRDIMNVDNTAILLLSEDGRYLTIRAALGLEEAVAPQVCVPFGHGFAGTIAANAEPLIVDDPSSLDIVTPLLREKLHVLLGVPLVVAGRVIGVIHVGTVSLRKFTDDDVQLLQRVADRIALAIDRVTIYEAEQRARTEATVHANELEAIIEAMADGVFIYDSQARLIQANRAARELFALDLQPNSATKPVQERVSQTLVRDEHGQLLPAEQWPMLRILRGEVLKGTHTVDILIRAIDGRDVQLSISGAPVYNATGGVIGGVLILHDVTERRRLERHTHNTLNALLEMAESLVLVEDEVDNEQSLNQLTASELKQADHTRNDVAQRLAELTCSVLGCKRVSISAVEPETEILFPIAVVGLSPEQEQQWWTEQQQASLRDNNASEFVSRLRANEVLVFDMTQPPFRDQPNPYNVHTVLIVPMCIGSELVGLLSLDHGGVAHEYTSDEIALAKAVARLGALVIERNRLLQERAEARATELALRESNRRMDTFLSMASHELRTPLTTIKGNVQLAQRQLHRLTSGKTNQPKKAHGEKNVEAQYIAPLTLPDRFIPLERVEAVETHLARAEHQIQFLNRLVGDLLDVSRIQADTLELHRKPCDLVALVRQTIEDQQQLFPNRTIRFLPPPPPDESIPVVADADCIGQVVTNYLSNALKYSAAAQAIEVRVQVEANAARVAVSDQGRGVPPAEQAYIWERFYRVPGVEVQSGSHVGLGLGLHISRTIIERHGGHVGVQSIPGQGSTFWFKLPLDPTQNSEDGNH